MKRIIIGIVAMLAFVFASAAPAANITCHAGVKCIGTAGNDTLYGTASDDWIVGRGGDDVIWGGNGADTMEGQQGNDDLFGQGGSWDFYEGGDGQDSFDAQDYCGHGATYDGGNGWDQVFYIDGSGSRFSNMEEKTPSLYC